MFKAAISVVLFCAAATFANADSFEPVTEQTRFEALVLNKKLTTLGVSLIVRPDGGIEGRAFGRNVTGEWDWRDGYFCRDLTFGQQELAPNCQLVTVAGDRIRFTSDFGTGQTANLWLK